VLSGIIAGVNSGTNRIYTSTPTFPGNSGGPLIVIRSPFLPEGGMTIGKTVLLAGIMLESMLIPPQKQGDAPMPALHLGVAAPTDAILGLLDSEDARAITTKIAPGPS
jgi:hypothetical protein